ncbi:MAG: 2-amino-4-hydroxy-6-hydroxymethyldihydropteridine diphosphokinase [Phycisphaerae bacterium]
MVATGGIYIGLGSNVGDRKKHILDALSELAQRGDVKVLQRSALHETDPVGGPEGQEKYLNCVAEVATALSPDELLKRMQTIENEHGRERTVANGPRTLDLDLLIYRDHAATSKSLTIPHPRMWARAFVMEPLREICPASRLADLRAAVDEAATPRKASPDAAASGMTSIDIKNGEKSWIDIYRLCIGFINPRPIALASTISGEGRLNVAPFSFYNMVCANPAVVFISTGMNRYSENKDTLRNIEQTREFCVATVTVDIAEQMVRCAAELPYGESEFAISGLTPKPATVVKAPLVAEAQVNIECRLREVMHIGTGPGSSNVIFGDIQMIHVANEVLTSEGTIDPHNLRTVGRLGGAYYANVTSPYEMQVPKVGS